MTLGGSILLAVAAMIANDIFVMERYPTLVRVYTKDVLNIRATDEEVSSLLPEAYRLFNQKKYLESVLHSAAALEYAIRSQLGVSPQYRWNNLVVMILQMTGISNTEKLRRIRQIRNIAMHPTPDTCITKEQSEEVLEVSSDLIRQLGQATQ
jgi:HEPN domain-containing protein